MGGQVNRAIGQLSTVFLWACTGGSMFTFKIIMFFFYDCNSRITLLDMEWEQLVKEIAWLITGHDGDTLECTECITWTRDAPWVTLDHSLVVHGCPQELHEWSREHWVDGQDDIKGGECLNLVSVLLHYFSSQHLQYQFPVASCCYPSCHFIMLPKGR